MSDRVKEFQQSRAEAAKLRAEAERIEALPSDKLLDLIRTTNPNGKHRIQLKWARDEIARRREKSI